MPIKKNPGEDKNTFISRCIADEINNGHEQSQATAICYKYWEGMESDKYKKLFEIIKVKKYTPKPDLEKE